MSKRSDDRYDEVAGRREGGRRREPNEREGDDDPQARFDAFHETRKDPEGRILKNHLESSRKRHKMIEGTEPGGTPGGPGSVNWTPIGPSVIAAGIGESGRITALAVGPGGTRVY